MFAKSDFSGGGKFEGAHSEMGAYSRGFIWRWGLFEGLIWKWGHIPGGLFGGGTYLRGLFGSGGIFQGVYLEVGAYSRGAHSEVGLIQGGLIWRWDLFEGLIWK